MPDVRNARADAPRYKTLDKDESRRGREETTISLRKDKRAEQLQKKRFGTTGMPITGSTPDTQSVGSQAWLEANPAALVEGVHSDDPNLQLPAVTQFRKLLSIERSPPIEEVIAAGVVPRFVQFLQAIYKLRTNHDCRLHILCVPSPRSCPFFNLSPPLPPDPQLTLPAGTLEYCVPSGRPSHY